MTHLLVLAGGFGNRLRPAVADVPKPLAPVAGKPYLYYLLRHWVAQGVTQFTFMLHYQADMVVDFLRQDQADALHRCSLNTLVEPTPLGTGGAVAYAVKTLGIEGDFLVTNADTWLGAGIQALAESQVPAIATVEVPDAERYGRVTIRDGKVCAFHEKQDSRSPGRINAGLYHLDGKLFGDWDGKPYSIERELFPCLSKTGRLNAVVLDTDFIDIGIPDDYYRFCRWIESGKRNAL